MTKLRGQILENESLARYTSWRVGGIAKRCYKPADIEDLSVFLQTLSADEEVVWLGLGSNTLIRDGGIKQTVILTQGQLKELSQTDPLTIRAEAGVACAQMARYCARQGLQGLEFLAGIPGTIGGALAMNAGCAGSETWDWVELVETLDQRGQFYQRTIQDYQVSYRQVIKSTKEWFIAGHFRLEIGSKEKSFEKIKQLLEYRANTQPTDEPNCGSVFRNPPGDYAARLIEQSGLKGYGIGQAFVSEKHANFIVNKGNATAADIEALILLIQDKIKQDHGIELIREVHIIGESS